jgi:beta-glucanase (GH16 family)
MIKKTGLFFLLGLNAVIVSPLWSQNSNELVWSDEFNGTSVDTEKWNFEIGNGSNGWGNNEKEYYTNRTDNADIVSGTLVITAKKESYGGYQYTSARMTTKNKGYWLYGRIEMSAKLPKGTGTWPAFWMMPQNNSYGTSYWPDNGEIDIMEYVGYEPGVIHGTVHTNKNNGSSGISKTTMSSGIEDNFHIYAVEWSADSIKWFVDSKMYGYYLRQGRDWHYWPFDKEFFIIINFAVGGNWGGAKGIDDTVFPQTYEIDYIRVYQKTGTGVQNANPAEKQVNVFPNPVNDHLNITLNCDNYFNSVVSVFDSKGSIVIPPFFSRKQITEINFSKFRSGIYMVLLQNNNKQESYKVMKL